MNVGIDLGTSHSLVAYLNLNGKVTLIPDMMYKGEYFLTPSKITFQGANALVGIAADQKSEWSDDSGYIEFFKRQLGRTEPLCYDSEGRPWYAEGLSALVIKKLMQDFHFSTRQQLSKATITVPAHFNDLQRRGVLYAASINNLEVHTLLDEPIAAAMHYGLTDFDGTEKYYFVFDLGGGTFDCSIVAINTEGIYVLATEGSSEIGGKEFDEVVMEMAIDQLPASKNPQDWNRHQWTRLRRTAQGIKHALSMPHNKYYTCKLPVEGDFISAVFERAAFEQGIRPYVQRCLELSQKCLKQAHLNVEDIAAFLMVGGSSQIPFVSSEIQSAFGVGAEKMILKDPSHAIVSGAVLRSTQISGKDSPTILPQEFKGLSSFFIGVRSVDHQGRLQTEKMIKRNALLPARSTKYFYAAREGQPYLSIVVTQFLDDSDDEQVLGTLRIGPLYNVRSNYQVAVTLVYDMDGTIRVEVYDPNNGQIVEHVFERGDELSSLMLMQKRMVEETHVNAIGV